MIVNSYMGPMAAIVSIVCLVSVIKSIGYLFNGASAPKKWYVAGKYLVVLYIGVLYGILTIDKMVIDIIEYPSGDYLFMLRVGSVMGSIVFLADAWLRDKLQ